MDNQRGHVVVLAYPAQGHINPLLQFAKRLSSKGLKATFVTTHYTTKFIKADDVDVMPISDGYDNNGFKDAPSVEEYLHSFKTVGSRTLTELIEKLNAANGSPVSCLVYDSLFPWAIDVAKQLGIYVVVLLTNSASVCSMYYQIHHGQLTLPVKEESFPLSLPGLPLLALDDMPSFLAQPTNHSAYLASIMEMFTRLDENDLVLLNSFEELEIEVANALTGLWPVQMVGPLVPSAYLDERRSADRDYGGSLRKTSDDSCLKWLDNKLPKSVIFVSFGSMAEIDIKQVEEIAWGLKISDHHFLWVVKDSEQSKLPTQFLHSLEDEKGLIVAWCNQLEVLANKAVGCFITHCGWNSTLEAISLGVPMVAMPQWSDQPTNAKFVEDVWGVGVRVLKDEKGIVGREEIERCVKELIVGEKNETIDINASRWKEHAKKAVYRGGSSEDISINLFKC